MEKISKLKVQSYIAEYIKERFVVSDSVVNYNMEQIDRFSLSIPTKSYSMVFRLLEKLLERFMEVDGNFQLPIMAKLLADIRSLRRYFEEYKSSVQSAGEVYEREFLQHQENPIIQTLGMVEKLETERDALLQEVEQTEKEIEKLGNRFDSPEYEDACARNLKTIKKHQQVTSSLKLLVHEQFDVKGYMKEEFIRQFDSAKESYVSSLQDILNCKTFYFDNLLWFHAKKSPLINEAESIDPLDYNLHYFLQKELEQTDDRQWREYLLSCKQEGF